MAHTPHSPSASTSRAPLPRVLIVDDDTIVAESLAEFLNREGYAAATCLLPEALATLGKSRGLRRWPVLSAPALLAIRN